jgi:hypothetical protein
MTHPPPDPRTPPARNSRAFLAILGGVSLVAVTFVALSLLRPQPETFLPSPIPAVPPEEPPSGIQVTTVDASDPARWVYFSFAKGSVVLNPGPDEWDLAFRRFQIISNGGEGFHGGVGVRALEGVSFEDAVVLPAHGYEETRARGDSVNPAIQRWYDYSFFSHLLTPRPKVYAVRTGSGEFVKFELLGYYCPGPVPGCLTFRWERVEPAD